MIERGRAFRGMAAMNLSDEVQGYRNVLAVVAGLTGLQTATAAMAVVVALTLKADGASSATIGAVASGFALGFLLGALISPAEIRRIGHIRSYALFAALASLAALAFSLGLHPVYWAMLQAVLGFCFAAILAAGESWVADASPPHRRGAILSFYHLVSKAGAAIGPFLVAGVAGGLGGFMVVAALFTLCLMPIAATNKAQPVFSSASPFGPRKLLKHAPAAAYSAFIAGVVNNAVAQLYPVFASSIQPDRPNLFAAEFNAALLAGAMVALWPAGLLSDRIDRRMVIALLAGTGAAAALAIVFLVQVHTGTGLLILAGLFGGGSLSYYAIAVAHAADRAEADQATSMMAGILVIWGLGSILGPALAGLVMSLPLGAPGLFAFSGVMLAGLGILMFTRAVNSDPVPEAEKEPFAVSPATSFAVAEFDPRGSEEEQLDLFDDFDPVAEPAPQPEAEA